ncbi:MAG TPA: zinc-ribbon domain-containing protein [Methanoregula sp.]|nr:zinc-ribbon domain-containing protein [Methanoregula sp.]
MGDPELRSDETVFLRTPGVYVKSIPFEGILTNKRIILVDRAKNLQPQKEIPLVTIKSIEPGENSIRDQTITLSVLARNGETRQMILTFSRLTGGNRIRDRNDWVKLLKENTSSSFDQVIRKVIPEGGPALKKRQDPVSPRVEVINSPVSKKEPAAAKPHVKREKNSAHPIKMMRESLPEPIRPSPAGKESQASEPSFGTYCSRCGNRVPEGSGFCNRCGSPIVVPGNMTAAIPPAVAVSQPAFPEAMTGRINSIDENIQTFPRIERPGVTILTDQPLQPATHEPENKPEIPNDQKPANTLPETIPQPSGLPVPETEEKAEPAAPGVITPQAPVSPLPEDKIPVPQKPANGSGFKLNKKAVFGIIGAIIIVVAVVGISLLSPMISRGEEPIPPDSIAPTIVSTTPIPSGTFVPVTERPAVMVPADGVYVHITYLGGWKGLYGMPSALQNVTNSGDRFYLVENATGTVQASFEKLDGTTKHALVVEIIKNGNLLKSGNTSAAFGKISLSVDIP